MVTVNEVKEQIAAITNEKVANSITPKRMGDVLGGIVEIAGNLAVRAELVFKTESEEVVSNGQLLNRYYNHVQFIKCQKGALYSTDKIRFARYGSRKKYWQKRRGWIVPNPEFLKYKMVLDHSDEKYDYWLVTDEEGGSLEAYEIERSRKEANQEYPFDSDSHKFPIRLTNKKCGLCIVRDDLQITDYMHWQVKVVYSQLLSKEVFSATLW